MKNIAGLMKQAAQMQQKMEECLPTPLVKKSFFGTILFPNFYVPSVSERSGAVF